MFKKALLSVLLGAALVSGSVLAEDKLRIASEGAYAPYNYLDDNGKLAGFEIDLGNALCEQVKMKCEWVTNAFDAMIPNLIAGNYDAIMAGMSITDERKKTITFSDEYKPVDPSLYVTTKDTKLDFEKLEGKNIGVQSGTIQAKFAEEKWGAKNKIKAFEKPDQSIADLSAGNVDMVLADGEFIRTMIKGAGDALVLAGPEEMIGGGIGIGLRQNDKELLEKLNGGLKALKESGKVDELIKKYFDAGPFYKK
ncbi:transporter substrate-binding domain-containing protein [Thiolinea disciformis]|uniref:transporter substrate-binding domain-containing protein n=1 Tax=Thiolinea disciformis TaxID=125614 RepID=UPI0003786392|nr:transporter substrate-binding domain-containing protein [Thiolinea disciformis]